MSKKEIKKVGRPANTKEIKRAKELRGKGLSYREIMRAMNKKDVKTIYGWVNCAVG